MADIAIFRINYKSDFILTLNSDAGWMTPFCIKFWTGAPSQAYFAGFDGTSYTHCALVAGEPTKLLVQFDDHHLPIGDLKFQIGYHFTVADFPTSVVDEVINQASVIIEVDDAPAKVMLDLNGETAPEIEFSLPAYANEAQRIANEEQRIAAEAIRIVNEESRIAAETIRQQNEAQRIRNEESRVAEFAQMKQECETATADANAAATLANEKAALATDKAALAHAAATLANEKAQLAADKAALAQAAADIANAKAALAQQKAEYAQTQGNYANTQGDYANEQGNLANEKATLAADKAALADAAATIANAKAQLADDKAALAAAAAENADAKAALAQQKAEYAQTQGNYANTQGDYAKAQGDYAKAQGDTAQADHTRAESDHTRAESDHAAVEMYVDSLGVFDLSKHNAVGGVLATYADLEAALNALNALDSQYKYGGMSFKFVLSSDNKYVQYRLMSDSFNTTPANWQGVDEYPTVGSENLVKSGGVINRLSKTMPIIEVKGIGTSGVTTLLESNHITDLLPNHTYYLWILNRDALKPFTTSSNSFEVYCTNGTTPVLVTGISAGSNIKLKEFYVITLPEGYNDIYIKVRQPSGVIFKAYLQDATYSGNVIPKNELPVKTKAVYQDIRLDEYGLVSHELDINGIAKITDLFELGNIYFTGSSPSYAFNDKRVRTAEGHSIYLKAGDVIAPISKTDFKFYLGWWNDNNTWNYVGWKSNNFTLTENGHYILLLANDTEVTQTSAETLASNLTIKRANQNIATKNEFNALNTRVETGFSTLDERVGNLDFKKNPFTKNNTAIDANTNPGKLITNNNYVCTDYIPITGGKRYRFALGGVGSSSMYALAFYTYNSETEVYSFVSGLNMSGIVDREILSTATHCIISTSKDYIERYGGMNGVYALDKFSKPFGDFAFFDEQTNAMIWTNSIPNQKEYSGANFVTNIFYYNVLPYKQIAFNIQNEDNSYGVRISCYDTNFNFISYQEILSNNPIYAVPSNAVFIKLSISKLSDGNLSPTTYTHIVDGMITIDNDNTQLKGDSAKNVDFLGLDNLYVIGHRANTGLPNVPENSVHAVYASAIQGVRSVECDVRLTSDGYPCIMHDATINRTMVNVDGTTISEDVSVSDLTWAELRANYKYKTSIEKYQTPITSLDEWLDAVKECHLVPFMHGCPTNLLYKVIERFGNEFIYMHGYATLLTVRTMAPNCLCLYDIGGSSETEAQLLTDLKNIGGFAGLSSMQLSRFTDNLMKLVKENGFFIQYSSNYDYPNAIAKGVDMILTDNWCNDSLSYRNLYRMKDDLSNITYSNTSNGCPVYGIGDIVDIPINGVVGNNIKILINVKGSLTAKVEAIDNLTYQLTGETGVFKTFEIGYNTNVDSFTLRLTATTEITLRDIVIQEN